MVLKYLPYYLRRKTNKKIVVIESDDWGLAMAPSAEAIEWAAKTYGRNKFSRYTTDALETTDDLELLYALLSDYKTKFENPPVITANFITHNLIYGNDCQINFAPITKTIKTDNEALYNYYMDGMKQNFIRPQLHGYSHYNLSKILSTALTQQEIENYKQEFFFVETTLHDSKRKYEGECSVSNKNYEVQFAQAQQVFSDMFGYYSASFIPPRYIIDKECLPILEQHHIKYLQAGNGLVNTEGRKYKVPFFRKYKNIFWGIRNCRLDPHPEYNFDAAFCIKSIEKAFERRVPAIIDFHRVNFSGTFNTEQRQKTISELKKVFDYLYEKHPDSIFTSSDKVMEVIDDR